MFGLYIFPFYLCLIFSLNLHKDMQYWETQFAYMAILI